MSKSTTDTKKKNDIKDSWPYLVWKEDRQRWMVDARTKDGGGNRKFFETRAEALTWRNAQMARRENEGAGAFADRELKAFGWTVTDAIKYALDHLNKTKIQKLLSDAIKDLIQFKTGDDPTSQPSKVVGKIRSKDIENRLNRFLDFVGDQNVQSVSADQIKAFLATITHPTTRNDYRKEIVLLWNYCRSKKWVSDSIVFKTDVPTAEEPEKTRKILTVEEAKNLMAASVDEDIRALNAMVLFGGVRVEEVEKLDWNAVNFKTGHIEISVAVSKVSSERFCPILPNLKKWLLPISKPSGRIVSRTLLHAQRKVWKKADLYPWTPDAHRHSFISYRRRIIGDVQTALDAGTSETVIKKHYKRPVTPKDANLYFAIVPTKS